MDIEVGTLRAVQRYIDMLEAKGIKPDNCTLDPAKDPTSLPHVLWMLKELQKKIIPGTGTGYSVDKFSRWLGFCQAILIVKGLTTVELERNTTRSWFTGATE